MEATAEKPEASCILPWQQAERLMDCIYSEAQAEQEPVPEPERVVKVSRPRRPKEPPMEQLSFFSMEVEESSGISDEEYLRECLKRGGNTTGRNRRIFDAVHTANTTKELAAFLKKEFGWSGSSITFSDHIRGSVSYQAKGAEIRFYTEPQREVRFSWSKVANAYTAMVADGSFSLTEEELEEVKEEQQEYEEFNTPQPEPEKPTLADLLNAPETVRAMLIENHVPRLVEMEKSADDIDSVLGRQVENLVIWPSDNNYVYIWNEDWLQDREKANIELLDRVIFGPVLIVKSEEPGRLVLTEPEDTDIQYWIGQVENARTVFSNVDIENAILGEYMSQGLPQPTDREMDALLLQMNESSKRCLVIELEGEPQSFVLDDEPDTVDQFFPEGELHRYSLETGIDLLYSASEEAPFTCIVDGLSFHGVVLLLAYGEDGKYISLTEEQVQQYSQQFSYENLSREPHPPGHDKVVAVSELAQEIQPKHHFYYADHPEAAEFQSGAKARYQDNLAALETLFSIEQEERQATTEEQERLAKYAGWGGLPLAFDSGKQEWEQEYGQLKELLEPRDYAAARASVLTSFYTPTFLIEGIYGALQGFGFQGGRILDPSTGTGRFLGAMPKEMAENSKLYAVELDSISSRIARQLYQDVQVYRGGFESIQYRDNSFDIAVTNVPFGDYQVADPRYDKLHPQIHDYFFAKSLNLVRPGGIVAFITSTGTMDKKEESFRRYLAQRADLIGAIRLPNNVFKTTGTDVISDVILLQKRKEIRDLSVEMPEWIYADEYEEEHRLNRYFINHPEMVLGELQLNSWQYGYFLDCVPREGVDLQQAYCVALGLLQAQMPEYAYDEALEDSIDALPEVKNFTYTVHDGMLYYREDDRMFSREGLKNTERQRITGMCGIRDSVQEIIFRELHGAADDELTSLREQLNTRYDRFVKDWGPLNNMTNARLFRPDIECNFLLALEKKQEDGSWQKTDIFSKRTVAPYREVTEVDNAHDALAMSLNERGGVDFPYMERLYKKTPEEIARELGDSIYLNPEKYDGGDLYATGWETREEYLSDNVRKKLERAKAAAQEYPELFSRNVEALEKTLPPWLEAGEIEARFAAPWIDKKYYNQFMYEVFNTPVWLQGNGNNHVNVHYNRFDSSWHVGNKGNDSSVTVREFYGTARANAYDLMEDLLNQRATTIRDKVDESKYVTNERETRLARAKQKQIRNAFCDWIFGEPERRKLLVAKYNELFNSTRLRQYDGSYLKLPGLNPGFIPYDHQLNGVARIQDGNHHTLLDHDVGFGKTATMIMGGYERLRLGLSKRCIYVVPNHIVNQFGKTIYSLYPNARAMIVSEKDFEKANRQKFLSRIAFSDVEMIVVGHSQFERIAMSPEYMQAALEKEANELAEAIAAMKEEQGTRFTVRQMEKQLKGLETRLEKLQNDDKKDKVITFEEMGIDCMFVDEADVYKNCYIFTKMQNVAGIGKSASQRAADMLMKCRYLNKNGGKIVFATGTPLSNALSEMYVMQRYLQEDDLHQRDIYHFDEWVASFAEATTSLEMAPEGKGFRERTRLCKYFNIPELLAMYHTVADVQTGELEQIDRPEIHGGEPEIRLCPASEDLKLFVEEGVQRCKAIRNGDVDPSEDNMLKFTHEAKLAGIDMRLLDPTLERDPEGKIATCAKDIHEIYMEYEADKAVQLVFCDVGTPKPDRFNVYHDLKDCLVDLGVPEQEVAFIHDAKNNKAKEELFRKCRTGEVRVLVGSTEKCGAGTNIQDRLIGEYELDCPWRPRDIIQRFGRIVRQGNQYGEVFLRRYITEGSFDAYLWGIVSTKWRFISQIRSGSFTGRSFEDQDETQISFEVAQAVATGNPDIMRRFELTKQISELQTVQADRRNQRYRLQDQLNDILPQQAKKLESLIAKLEADVETAKGSGTQFQITIEGKAYDNRNKAGIALIAITKTTLLKDPLEVGKYRGLRLFLHHPNYDGYTCRLVGAGVYTCEVNRESGIGTCTRLENMVEELPKRLQMNREELETVQKQMVDIQEKLDAPIEGEEELREALEELAELEARLTIKEEEQEAGQQEEEEVLQVDAEMDDELEI